MRAIYCLFLFLLINSLWSVDFESEAIQSERMKEGRRIYQTCAEIAKIYQKVDGFSIKDITDELDDQRLKESCRRIVLVQYPSDGLLIKGYVSFIDTPDEKPLLVFLRGGNELFGLMHPVTSYSLLGDYTIVATCYRGGVSEGQDEFGGADVADVYHLVQHIPNLEKELNFKVGSKRRFIMGGSRGGLEMFLALNRYPDLQAYFDGAIALSAPLNLKAHIHARPDMLKMFQNKFGYSDDNWLKMRNPLSNLQQIQADFRFLIIQGTDDHRVPISEGRAMTEALKAKGCTVEYIEVAGGEHCLQNKAEERQQMLLEWLAK